MSSKNTSVDYDARQLASKIRELIKAMIDKIPAEQVDAKEEALAEEIYDQIVKPYDDMR